MDPLNYRTTWGTSKTIHHSLGLCGGAATSQKTGISGRGVRKNLKAYVDEAGLRGQYRGHSFRVGTAQSLAQRGATLTQMQTVGRWQTARMPAAYCRNELAGRNAVATLLYKNKREHD